MWTCDWRHRLFGKWNKVGDGGESRCGSGETINRLSSMSNMSSAAFWMPLRRIRTDHGRSLSKVMSVTCSGVGHFVSSSKKASEVWNSDVFRVYQSWNSSWVSQKADLTDGSERGPSTKDCVFKNGRTAGKATNLTFFSSVSDHAGMSFNFFLLSFKNLATEIVRTSSVMDLWRLN